MLKDSSVTANIPAADLGRAREFYADKLGLTPSGENPGGLIYTTGGGTVFFLYETEFAGPGGPHDRAAARGRRSGRSRRPGLPRGHVRALRHARRLLGRRRGVDGGDGRAPPGSRTARATSSASTTPGPEQRHVWHARRHGSARLVHHPRRGRPRCHPTVLRRRPRLGAGLRAGGRGADVPGRRQGRAVAVGRVRLRGRGRADPAGERPGPDHPRPQPRDPRRRSTASSTTPGPPARTRSRTASSASGAATPATSPTPTASAGRSPTTPDRSGSPSSERRHVGPRSHDPGRMTDSADGPTSRGVR